MEQVAHNHVGAASQEPATKQLVTTPTLKPNNVRLASPFEEEATMELCRELHSENGIFPLSEPKVRGILGDAFKRQGGILGVIGAPGRLQAMIYMHVTSMWYTEDPCLEELFTYVRPEFRKSRNAVELLHFAKWSAETAGWPLFIGVISNKHTERKVQLYQRQFPPVGNFFLYNHPSVVS